MQLYDLLYIIPSPNTKNDVEKINQVIKDDIKKLKGEIISEKNLGNKKLAYEIEKKDKGFYISMQFKLDPSNLENIKNKLSSSSNVLRFMIVKISEIKKKERKHKPKENKDDLKEKPEEKPEKKEEETDNKDDDIKNISDKIDDILNN